MPHAIDSSLPACSEAAPDASPCWQVWFDGGALPNPGKMAVGVILISPVGLRSDKAMLTGGCGCNNEAELHALCMALETASAAGARRLVVRGDSDVALCYVRGPDSTQITRLLVLVARAREWMRCFDEVQLIWVPRHRNIAADRLARAALGLLEMPARSAKGRRRRR